MNLIENSAYSQRRMARFAGFMYLFIIIESVLVFMFVDAALIVPDAVAAGQP